MNSLERSTRVVREKVHMKITERFPQGMNLFYEYKV
jgi:hypothetical protein